MSSFSDSTILGKYSTSDGMESEHPGQAGADEETSKHLSHSSVSLRIQTCNPEVSRDVMMGEAYNRTTRTPQDSEKKR